MAFAPAAGAAGAEVAVGLLDGVALSLLVTWLVLAGLAWSYRHSLGALLTVLAHGLRAVRIHVRFINIRPLRGLANRIDDLNHAIHNGLGHAARNAENSAIYTFHAAGALQAWTASEVEALSAAWLQGMHDIIHRDIPAAQADVLTRVRNQVHGIDRVVNGLRAWTQALVTRRIHALDKLWQARLRTYARGIDRATHALTSQVARVNAYARTQVAQIRGITVKQARRIARLERAITTAGTAGLATLRARVGRLEREVAGIKAGKVAKVGAGVVSVALAELGLSWLRCRNVSRVGKRICGMDQSLLDSLLVDSLALLVAFDLREFAEDVGAVTDDVGHAVVRFTAGKYLPDV